MKSTKILQPPKHRLEVRQYDYGWNVSYFDDDGYVKHLVSANSEIQAFRSAHRLVHLYQLSGQILVALKSRPEFLMDVERLMYRVDNRK